MKHLALIFICSIAIIFIQCKSSQNNIGSQLNKKITTILPSSTVIIAPTFKKNFNNDNTCPERKLGGNAITKDGYLVFEGATDGNRQVDPQIAVGGNYILHGTNSGLIVYDKEGKYLSGVTQKCFKNGIDPKLFYDMHNKVFGFDLWEYWDSAKIKPVHVSISSSSNPLGSWNTYSVPAPKGVDGGAISFSKKWIGYSFPGGDENTFVLKMADAKAGRPAKVYYFKGSLGHPVAVQDNIDALYFFDIDNKNYVIKKIVSDKNGDAICEEVSRKAHNMKNFDWPPQSPQKGTTQLTSSGDRNPKNVVLQDGFIWFSHTVNINGRAGVQWHQLELNGTVVQEGEISSPTSSYIQTTLAVNKNKDVLIGFQETSTAMYISPRMTFRKNTDAPGSTRPIISLGEGKGATDGVAWGDYSGSIVDGDNLLDLWTVQSITTAKGKGELRIAKIPF